MFLDGGIIKVMGDLDMWRETSDFWGYVKDDTHSLGSGTGAIMAWSTISCRSFSIASLHSMGTFLLAFCTGGQKGLGKWCTLQAYCL